MDSEVNKIAKARKTRKSLGTLDLKKFEPGKLPLKKFGPKYFFDFLAELDTFTKILPKPKT